MCFLKESIKDFLFIILTWMWFCFSQRFYIYRNTTFIVNGFPQNTACLLSFCIVPVLVFFLDLMTRLIYGRQKLKWQHLSPPRLVEHLSWQCLRCCRAIPCWGCWRLPKPPGQSALLILCVTFVEGLTEKEKLITSKMREQKTTLDLKRAQW